MERPQQGLVIVALPGRVPPDLAVRVSLLGSQIGPQNLDAKKGAEPSARVRRAKAARPRMKPLDWIAVRLDEEAEEIVNKVIARAEAGDWRAAAWLFDRVYGKPQERVEVTDPLENKNPLDMTPSEIDAALARLITEEEQRGQDIPQ